MRVALFCYVCGVPVFVFGEVYRSLIGDSCGAVML